MSTNLPASFVDEYSLDVSGWARFSTDHRKRFRLARSLVPGHSLCVHDGVIWNPLIPGPDLVRIVFLMLNPSTATAFVVDPTVRECIAWARSFGGHVLEVVNLFAMRSPHPKDLRFSELPGFPEDLRDQVPSQLGIDAEADEQILLACRGARRVFAAWGTNGALYDRAAHVRELLAKHGVELFHLGLSKDGYPKHPLARGKHRIPRDQQPERWAA